MPAAGLLLPRGVPEALALPDLVPRLDAPNAAAGGRVVKGQATQPVLLLLKLNSLSDSTG